MSSIPYQFLSFAKVLNLRLANGDQQIEWIDLNVDSVVEPYARLRLDTLKGQVSSVGQYLYASGRCAVAHASEAPRVDPDDPDDLNRLREDMPLMRALARLFIERKLGVKTLSTMAREREAERRKGW